MSRRHGINKVVHRDADAGEPPDQYVGVISADIRVFWPPRASRQEVLAAMAEAYTQAWDEVLARVDA